MAEKSKSYKNTGVYPIELADGRIVAVGEFESLTAKQLEDEGNQLHITEGRLTLASTEPEAVVGGTAAETTTSGKKGGS